MVLLEDEYLFWSQSLFEFIFGWSKIISMFFGGFVYDSTRIREQTLHQTQYAYAFIPIKFFGEIDT